MGGVSGLERAPERIAHLGSGEGVPFADAEELTEFDVGGVFVTMAGTALFDDDQTFDVGEGEKQFTYLQPLDEQWVDRTATTVCVFTTPVAAVEGESLNPLAEVSEETFVTARGGRYLSESGMLSASGLGSNLSWVVSPAEVGSQSVTLFDKSSPLLSYLGLIEDESGDIRTVIIHIAKATLDDETAFGVGVQHRKLWTGGSPDAVASLVEELESRSVPELVGDDETAVVERAGIDASAAHVAAALAEVRRTES